MDAGREPGPRPDPHPLDLHARLVADRVAVVSRRDVEHVTRREDRPRPVHEVDPEAAGDDEADVARLAPLAADGRAHVLGPAPAWLRDELTDRQVAELDDPRPDVRELDDVVGLLEALRNDVCHD